MTEVVGFKFQFYRMKMFWEGIRVDKWMCLILLRLHPYKAAHVTMVSED